MFLLRNLSGIRPTTTYRDAFFHLKKLEIM